MEQTYLLLVGIEISGKQYTAGHDEAFLLTFDFAIFSAEL